MDNSTMLRHRYVKTNGVTLHLVEAGPADGPLILLLHGFPEFWWSWRAQIPVLAAAGFRVVVPDQRGYFLSDKPAGAHNYTLPILATDVVGLLDTYGYASAHIVGHDWGGAVAWQIALMYPERISKLVILNAPHPGAMLAAIKNDVKQMAKSWYILAFQLRGLAEKMASVADWKIMSENVKASARAGIFTDLIMLEYKKTWSVPGAMTAMMNWYRALLIPVEAGYEDHIVQPATLILWGKRDQFLEPAMAELSLTYCRDGALIFFDDISHWIQHEASTEVNERLIAFLGSV